MDATMTVRFFLCTLDYQGLLSLAETAFSLPFPSLLLSACVWHGLEWSPGWPPLRCYAWEPTLSALVQTLSSMSDSVSSLKLWELILLLYFPKAENFLICW